MCRAAAVLLSLSLACATRGPSVPARCEGAYEHVDGVLRAALAERLAAARSFAVARAAAAGADRVEERARRRAEAWRLAHREQVVGYCAGWSDASYACAAGASDARAVAACGPELDDVVRSFTVEVVEPSAATPRGRGAPAEGARGGDTL